MHFSSHVLYVDDDSDDRDVFVEVLRDTHPTCGCLLAQNGMEALNLLSHLVQQPVCIYADLNMPRLSGLEFLAAIKADKRLSQIPIFILSTSSDVKFKTEAKLLGADGYYTKPNSYSEYVDMVKMSLTRFQDQ